jgi:hypothetical protein
MLPSQFRAESAIMLNDMRLSGSLPENLKDLKIFGATRNYLSGSVSVGRGGELSTFIISSNYFSCEVGDDVSEHSKLGKGACSVIACCR